MSLADSFEPPLMAGRGRLGNPLFCKSVLPRRWEGKAIVRKNSILFFCVTQVAPETQDRRKRKDRGNVNAAAPWAGFSAGSAQGLSFSHGRWDA